MCSTSRGGEGRPEERGHIALPSCMGLRGRLQPFRGLCVPQALRARPTNHRGSRSDVWSRSFQWDGRVLRGWGSCQACCCTTPAPHVRPLRAHDVCILRGHGVASDDTRWEERASELLPETPGKVPVGLGIFLGGTLQSVVHQPEEGHKIPAVARGREGTVALRPSEPSVHLRRRAAGCAEEVLVLVVAGLPRKVPQPRHVLEGLVHGGPPRRAVAGNRESCASAASRASPEQKTSIHSAPAERQEATQSALSPAGRCRASSSTVRRDWGHVHVYQGLFPAPAEDSGLWEDWDAREPLLAGAEPALHQRVAVSGPQRPVVGGRRGEVPGVDVGRGVGRAQWRVPSMRGRLAW